MSRRIILLAIFALLTIAAPIYADDSPAWTAWLHYGRHMTLIDSDGHTLRELDLPMPDAKTYFQLLPAVGISKDGRLVAYIAQNAQSTQLVVFNMVSNQIARLYTRNPYTYRSMSQPNNRIFDETDAALAFGYMDGELYDHIHLGVWNINSGELVYELDTSIASLGLPTDWIAEPHIMNFEGDKVTFALKLVEPYATNPDIWQPLIWNILTNTIQPDVAFPSLEAEVLGRTQEIVAPSNDSAFPINFELAANESKPHVYPNVLQVYDPILRQSYPFYWSDKIIPQHGFFVQNGERILLQFRSKVQEISKWALLERHGTVVDEWELPDNFQVKAAKETPEGFLYITQLKIPDSYSSLTFPAVYEVDTRDDKLDTGRLVWQIPMKEFHAYFDPSEQASFDIAWVHSDAPVGPFKPWAQLADPVYAPTPQPSTATITPTMIPTPPPLFYVGQTVRVQTIDGEILNLRAKPTRKSDILVYIEDDTLLELLEGPVEAEGYHWWRVHTPDGLEGWVVENDGELQTILPE